MKYIKKYNEDNLTPKDIYEIFNEMKRSCTRFNSAGDEFLRAIEELYEARTHITEENTEELMVIAREDGEFEDLDNKSDDILQKINEYVIV